MSGAFVQVVAPMLSVNEPEAQLIELFVTPGGKVTVGDPLCTLETTKATFEVQAEVDGYIHEVLVRNGQLVNAGAVLFRISSEPPVGKPEEQSEKNAPISDPEERPDGLLITDKGMRLARQLGVALKALPLGTLVTEGIVRRLAANPPATSAASWTSLPEITVSFDSRQLLIFGAGGHAKTIIDVIRQSNQYQIAGVIDDQPPGESLMGVPVLGGEEVLKSLYDRGIRLLVNGVGAINRNRTRHEIFVRMAERGFAFPTIVHPKAVIEPSAKVSSGVQIFGMAFVGSDAKIGFGAIINTGAIVSHDCKIGDLAHVTPGVVLAGDVEVGTGALIGMGVTTALGVKIGEWARIGNGARVNGDVPPHAIVHAGASWP